MISSVSFKALAFASSAAAIVQSTTKFDPLTNTNLAVYWGQGPDQPSLAHFCADTNIDVIPIGFVNQFPDQTGGYPGTNFGNQCDGKTYKNPNGTPSQLLSGCAQIGPDIKTCQALGKKILLSLGGAYPTNQHLTSQKSATDFANFLWRAFGPDKEAKGSTFPRPFGDAAVDGFDFDIENVLAKGENPQDLYYGYSTMVTTLRSLYATDKTPRYISGAPQCIVPDAHLANAVENSWFDFLFVQFYNTPQCSARAYFDHTYGAYGGPPTDISYDSWITFVQQKSFNKNVKVFLGLPAAPAVTYDSKMYLSPDEAKQILQHFQCKYPSSFGGAMVYEATYSENNQVNGKPYADALKGYLTGSDCAKKPPGLKSITPSASSFPTLSIAKSIGTAPFPTGSPSGKGPFPSGSRSTDYRSGFPTGSGIFPSGTAPYMSGTVSGTLRTNSTTFSAPTGTAPSSSRPIGTAPSSIKPSGTGVSTTSTGTAASTTGTGGVSSSSTPVTSSTGTASVSSSKVPYPFTNSSSIASTSTSESVAPTPISETTTTGAPVTTATTGSPVSGAGTTTTVITTSYITTCPVVGTSTSNGSPVPYTSFTVSTVTQTITSTICPICPGGTPAPAPAPNSPAQPTPATGSSVPPPPAQGGSSGSSNSPGNSPAGQSAPNSPAQPQGGSSSSPSNGNSASSSNSSPGYKAAEKPAPAPPAGSPAPAPAPASSNGNSPAQPQAPAASSAGAAPAAAAAAASASASQSIQKVYKTLTLVPQPVTMTQLYNGANSPAAPTGSPSSSSSSTGAGSTPFTNGTTAGNSTVSPLAFKGAASTMRGGFGGVIVSLVVMMIGAVTFL